MSGNEELLSSGSGIVSAAGNGLSSNIDYGTEPCGETDEDCCETAERPVAPMSRGKYPITIHHLDFGYNVKIGCQTFAVETPEKLLKNLEAYLKDPSGTERKWMGERKLL